MEDIKNDYGEVTREQLRALGAAMSEATEPVAKKDRLLDSAIDEIERVLIGNKSEEVNEIYLRNAIRFIKEYKE